MTRRPLIRDKRQEVSIEIIHMTAIFGDTEALLIPYDYFLIHEH